MKAKLVLFLLIQTFSIALFIGRQPGAFAAEPQKTPSLPASPTRAESGYPVTPWFPISPVDGELEAEQSPSAAYNSTQNQYLVVWADNLHFLLYGQRVSQSGALIGDRFPISGCAVQSRTPDIAYNQLRNKFVVVSKYYTSTGVGVCITQLDGDGVLIGLPLSVTYSEAYGFWLPKVAATSDEYLVTWAKLDSANGTDGIEARSINFLMMPVSDVIEITGLQTSQPFNPDVACVDKLLSCIMVWDQHQAGSETAHDVLGQRLELWPAPHKAGSIFLVFDTSADEAYPSISSVAPTETTGQYLVAATSSASGGSIIARLYDGAGVVEAGFTVAEGASGYYDAVAGSSSTLAYLVTWVNAADSHIQAATVTGNGTVAEHKQPYPAMEGLVETAIAAGANGDYLVAGGKSPGAPDSDIFGFLWGTRLYLPVALKQ